MLNSCLSDHIGYLIPKDETDHLVRIHVDWSLFDKEVPTGMTVMVFSHQGGAPRSVLTNDITHADFRLPPGKYSALVFNQSSTEFGSLVFVGMDSYATARVLSQTRTSTWFSRAGKEILAVEPEWLAVDRIESFEVKDDEKECWMYPRNVTVHTTVEATVEGIQNLRSARGSLSGIARGYYLGLNRATSDTVTYLMEKWTKKLSNEQPSQGVLCATFQCFALPDGHTGDASSNRFDLSVLLTDGKTQVDNTFWVGDKFEVIRNEGNDAQVEVRLRVGVRFPAPLPEMKPMEGENSGGGGFDISIEEWGKPEDIDMEI